RTPRRATARRSGPRRRRPPGARPRPTGGRRPTGPDRDRSLTRRGRRGMALAVRPGGDVELLQIVGLRAVLHRSAVDPLRGELGTAAELEALERERDHVVGLADDRHGITSLLDRLDALSEHPPQGDDADVALGDVLAGAVGDRALGDPRHDVLALDVVDDVVAVGVAPLV